MARRTLVLRREQLTELTSADLDRVVAGAPPAPPTEDCPDNTYYCITGHAICGETRALCQGTRLLCT